MHPAMACVECEFRQRNCEGNPPCLVDDRGVLQHIESGYCPHPFGPKFGDGKKPAMWADVAMGSCDGGMPVHRFGPGDVVKAVLDQIGYRGNFGCGCRRMQRQMNEWGFFGCWRHRREIYEWFREKARASGVELTLPGLFAELRRAWRASRE